MLLVPEVGGLLLLNRLQSVLSVGDGRMSSLIPSPRDCGVYVPIQG